MGHFVVDCRSDKFLNFQLQIYPKILTMEGMPVAPIPPKLPKYFPDLQGANRGKTPGAGWFQNEFQPWLQEVNSKYFFGYGVIIASTFVAGMGLAFGGYYFQDEVRQFPESVMVFTGQAKEKMVAILGQAKETLEIYGVILTENLRNIRLIPGQLWEKIAAYPQTTEQAKEDMAWVETSGQTMVGKLWGKIGGLRTSNSEMPIPEQL